MPFFKYIARDKTGKIIEEVIESVSQDDLLNSLQARGLYVVSMGLAPEVKKIKRALRRYHTKVTNADLIMFSSELATLLSSGVTLIKSLDILCKQIESKTLLRVVEQVKKDVEGGYTFQNALKKHQKVFSYFWINLVETGEASGHLPSALEQLAGYLEQSEALRKKITSAMIYPMILVFVATSAIAIFLLKIIPVFEEIFKGFGVDLPVLTQVVVNISWILRKYFLIIIGSLVVAIVGIKKYISTEKGRWQFDAFLFKVPVLGQVMQEISTERFTVV